MNVKEKIMDEIKDIDGLAFNSSVHLLGSNSILANSFSVYV